MSVRYTWRGAPGSFFTDPKREEPCFYCLKPLTLPAIHWGCSQAEIWIHPECLAPLVTRLFRDLHEVEQFVIREETPSFRAWLLRQVDRDDPVGDLARDAAADSRFPAAAHQAYRYLGFHAVDGAREALHEARREWRRERSR